MILLRGGYYRRQLIKIYRSWLSIIVLSCVNHCVLLLIFLGSPTFPPTPTCLFLMPLHIILNNLYASKPAMQDFVVHHVQEHFTMMQLECHRVAIANIQYVTYFFSYMPLVLTSIRRPTGWHGEDSNGGTVCGHITI